MCSQTCTCSLSCDAAAITAVVTRPDAAPNKNFISEWGESLRQGAAEAWAPYLASTYQVANLQVAKPVSGYCGMVTGSNCPVGVV